MKKVGIIGGTFDPVHIGHIKIAKSALSEFGLDEVRFMTGGMPPHKRDRKITDSAIRHRMTECAVEDEKNLVADDYELSKKEYTYTANILTELREKHPDWEIYFIIGEDSLRDFLLWYKPQTVVKKCILLVYPRVGDTNLEELVKERTEQLDADIRIIHADTVNVSSTQIRSRVEKGEDINGMCPESVIRFIEENGLYRNKA